MKELSSKEQERVRLRRERLKKAQDWLMEPGNNFCALPYAHMAIEANGAIRPCCLGTPFKDLNIQGKSIDEAFQSPIRGEFIDQFDKNKKASQCAVCWKDDNKFSNRVKFSTNEEIIDIVEDKMNGIEPKRELKWLEIKPGNRCNLKCRICGVHNSSMWTKDAYEMTDYFHSMDPTYDEDRKKFKESSEYKYTESCKWIDDGDFWKQIEGMTELRLVHFMGGEPFMVPEHFNLLKNLIKHPDIDTSKIVVRYNTNGTYFPTEEQIEIWKQFSGVKLHISVDDIGERFEYQRNLAEWDKVKQILLNFKKLEIESKESESDWYLTALMDPTISLYNIWYIDEIERGFAELGYSLNRGNSHFVSTGWNDARALPEEVKDIIIDKFKGSNSEWIQGIIGYLGTPQARLSKKHDIVTAYKQMMFLDHLRGERFDKLYPELYKLILPHIDWSRVNKHRDFKEVRYE
jgi:MoaA/NifB/PqqE/SkfB family radical SAM enzyme